MSTAEGWGKTSLDSVISVIQSGSRPQGGVSSDRGEIPSLGGENIIATGGVSLGEVKLVPSEFYARMTKGHLRDGDVLINKDGAQTGKVGLYQAPNNPPACINEHLFLLRGRRDLVDQKYLYYTLLSQDGQKQIRSQISGSAQPGLKSGFIKGILADIPRSLSEQSKIAEILSKVDWAIEQTEALIAKQQRIKTGLMQDLLTRGIDEHGNLRSEETHKFKDSPLGRIPVEWDVSPAHSLCTAVIDCKNRTPPVRSDGHPVIRTPNVRAGKFVFEDLLFTDPKSYEIWTARGKPKAGDVVITREAPFGEACIIPEEVSEACLGQRMMLYQSNPKKLNNEFLLFAIYSEQVQKRLLELAGGSTVGHIRVGDIRYLAIPHPIDLEEQERVASVLSGIADELEQHSKVVQKLHRTKTALMQDLLTGEKRVTALLEVEQAAGSIS